MTLWSCQFLLGPWKEWWQKRSDSGWEGRVGWEERKQTIFSGVPMDKWLNLELCLDNWSPIKMGVWGAQHLKNERVSNAAFFCLLQALNEKTNSQHSENKPKLKAKLLSTFLWLALNGGVYCMNLALQIKENASHKFPCRSRRLAVQYQIIGWELVCSIPHFFKNVILYRWIRCNMLQLPLKLCLFLIFTKHKLITICSSQTANLLV